jgi:hypothetical protein
VNERSRIIVTFRSLLFEFRDAPFQALKHGLDGVRIDRAIPVEDGSPQAAYSSLRWYGHIRCHRQTSRYRFNAHALRAVWCAASAA